MPSGLGWCSRGLSLSDSQTPSYTMLHMFSPFYMPCTLCFPVKVIMTELLNGLGLYGVSFRSFQRRSWISWGRNQA
jgi:hypothetical protein